MQIKIILVSTKKHLKIMLKCGIINIGIVYSILNYKLFSAYNILVEGKNKWNIKILLPSEKSEPILNRIL